MTLKIKDLEKLQSMFEDAQKAIDVLNRDPIEVQYDPLVPASVESALKHIEHTINEKTARFRGNDIVEKAAASLKRQYREYILALVAEARLTNERGGMEQEENQVSVVLHQVENTVMDLRAAGYQTFDRHIKKLSHCLRNPVLKEINGSLLQGVDLEGWLEAGRATQGGPVGSAKLEWPVEIERELGIHIALIHYFASQEDRAFQFAHTFYYVHGGDITDLFRHMVGQLLIPFARDYVSYVKKKVGVLSVANVGAGGVSYSQQFVINNSTITSLQTGHQSVAIVEVSNGGNSKDVLLKAFEVVAEALARAQALPGHDKAEIVDLVNEGKAELGKEKPNWSKLKSYLPMIGSSISVMADMQPAYDGLKTAASLIGVTLP